MRIVGKILKWFGIAIAVLIAAGAVYAQIGLALDARHAPPKAEMIAVGGRRVHVVCRGQGPRTYVLDAGLGGWSVFWWRIQPLLAEGGRVCAFDRAGTGWSDRSGGDHDGATLADELAATVAAAKIPTPFFYVGHSLGANLALIYYARHPADVAGLVLLEPGNPKDLLEDFHGTRAEAMQASGGGAPYFLATAAGYLGVTRLVALSAPGKSFSGEARAQYKTGLGRPDTLATSMACLAALPKTAYEIMDVKSLGDTPVLVFYSSEPRQPEGNETAADVKVWHQGYLAYLASLAAMSSQGIGPIEVPGSSHKSMVLGEEQAAVVAKSIAEFAAR
ncbi:MAG TPA: alpha/beta hydrolase [Thermoanaerobaculia bacterium]|nr:alpha/beta hydrolase [Thermoanaerobaculia bacterium]